MGAWLEQHAAYLRSLIPKRSGGFTWAQIAEAMNKAGITYGEGRRLPRGGTSRGYWTAEHIRLAARGAAMLSEARRKARDAGRAAAGEPASPPAAAPAEPAAEGSVMPKLRIHGLEVLQPKPEAGETHGPLDEKEARRRAVLDRHLKRQQEGQ